MKLRIQMTHGANLFEAEMPLRVRLEGVRVVLVAGPSNTPLGIIVAEMTLSTAEVAAIAKAGAP